MRTSRASRGAPTPAKPRKLYGKPALVSSLLRLAGLLGGGGSPERTGLVPSLRLLPLVGRPESSREFVRQSDHRAEFAVKRMCRTLVGFHQRLLRVVPSGSRPRDPARTRCSRGASWRSTRVPTPTRNPRLTWTTGNWYQREKLRRTDLLTLAGVFWCRSESQHRVDLL